MTTAVFDDATEFASPIAEGHYIVELAELKAMPEEHSRFGPALSWSFKIWDRDTGEPILYQSGDNAGEEYLFFQSTSTKMTTGSKARNWASALLGRAIRNGESGAEIAKAILGKRAFALVVHNEQGRPRIPIEGLTPYRSKPARVAPPPDDFQPFDDDEF